mmetsp:Transcript_36747/g.118152  ORF Transcript_36747/g.118152 Transcript_36747/m.118152 type:complete len:251 (+) Transcript_36747:364-1116(+)
MDRTPASLRPIAERQRWCSCCTAPGWPAAGLYWSRYWRCSRLWPRRPSGWRDSFNLPCSKRPVRPFPPGTPPRRPSWRRPSWRAGARSGAPSTDACWCARARLARWWWGRDGTVRCLRSEQPVRRPSLRVHSIRRQSLRSEQRCGVGTCAGHTGQRGTGLRRPGQRGTGWRRTGRGPDPPLHPAAPCLVGSVFCMRSVRLLQTQSVGWERRPPLTLLDPAWLGWWSCGTRLATTTPHHAASAMRYCARWG